MSPRQFPRWTRHVTPEPPPEDDSMSNDSSTGSGRAGHSDAEQHHKHLRDIFMDATNVKGFTETQNQRARSRRVVDEESDSVAEAVATFVKDDGLTDTYADPIYKSDGE